MPDPNKLLKRKKILFVVLNWGLGHATRTSVLIEEALRLGAEVYIASDGEALRILENDFPNATHLTLPGYNIRYGGQTLMSLFAQIPHAWKTHRADAAQIRLFHKQYQFDGVISDNRPGGYLAGIPSVYMSHQLRLKAGWFGGLLSWGHYQMYKRYTQVWVPDTRERVLSGDLSMIYRTMPAIRYIGTLSRVPQVQTTSRIPWVAILSGPEPSRGEWERQLFSVRSQLPSGGLIVRGKPLEADEAMAGVENYASKERLAEIYSSAEVVIARAGYSTLMDLWTHGKRAILIPTPGQPEQEYLGEVVCQVPGWKVSTQKDANYPRLLEEVKEEEEPQTKVGLTLPDDLFNLFKGKGES